MYVQTTKDELVRIKSEHTLHEVIEFSDNNTAQVTQEVGESMIEHYETITEK